MSLPYQCCISPFKLFCATNPLPWREIPTATVDISSLSRFSSGEGSVKLAHLVTSVTSFDQTFSLLPWIPCATVLFTLFFYLIET